MTPRKDFILRLLMAAALLLGCTAIASAQQFPAYHHVAGGKSGPYRQAKQDGAILILANNEVNGTIAHDLSGNGNNGTFTGHTLGGAGPLSRMANGGGAVALNGMTGGIAFSNPVLRSPTALTIECWFRAASFFGFPSIFDNENSGSGGGVGLSLNTGGNCFFRVIDGTGAASQATSTVAGTTSTWTHIAASWNGSTVSFYTNGSSAGSGAISRAVGVNTQSAKIGNATVSVGNFFNGSIALTAVYPTALTANQIKFHYLAGINGYAVDCKPSDLDHFATFRLHDDFDDARFGDVCAAFNRIIREKRRAA
jgi:hypothetical protein